MRENGPLPVGSLPVGSLLPLAAGLAEALVAIHAAGVVHRDLKPSKLVPDPRSQIPVFRIPTRTIKHDKAMIR